MDTEKLVALITNEVLRRLGQPAGCVAAGEPPPKVLALFTGGTIGLEAGLEQLRAIQAWPAAVTVVLSPAAEHVVGKTRLCDALGSGIPLVTAREPYPGKALRDADLILLPVLTQNTAAKLAYTLADTLVTTLVLQALMLGKPVIAAANAADPLDNWRIGAAMGHSPPGLRRALQENLKRIESYGVRIVRAEALAAEAKAVLVPGTKNKPPVAAGPAKVLITAETVKTAAAAGTKSLSLPPAALITPLARDTALACGIQLVIDGRVERR